MRRFLVASCLAEVTQQIHSFRASGVISDHRLLAVALDSMAFRKSAGSSCTVPSASFGVAMLNECLFRPTFEWWHRRDLARIQLETLLPVANQD